MAYGYKVYFSERPRNRVICYDPDSREARVVAGEPRDGDVTQRLNDPYGLTLDKSGRLLIADKLNNRVCRVESGKLVPLPIIDGNGHRKLIPGSRYRHAQERMVSPTGLFCEKDGAFLCAFSDDRTVYRIHSNGHLELLLGIPPNRPQVVRKIRDVVPQSELKELPLFGPTAVTESADGTIVFIERGYQSVRQYHSRRGVRTIFPSAQSRAFRHAGNSSRAVQIPEQGALSEYHPAFPSAVAFDSDGLLYLSDIQHKRILAIDLTRQCFSTVLQAGATETAGKYAGFAFGPKGAVWVLDAAAGTIQEYSRERAKAWVAVGAPVTEVAGKRFQFFPAGAGMVCG